MEVDDGGLKMNAENGQHLPSPSQLLGKQTSTSSYRLVSPRCSTRPLFQEMLDLATPPLCYSTDVRVLESQCCCCFFLWLMISPTPQNSFVEYIRTCTPIFMHMTFQFPWFILCKMWQQLIWVAVWVALHNNYLLIMYLFIYIVYLNYLISSSPL